jgi:predicted phage terminase large subunit-like protein
MKLPSLDDVDRELSKRKFYNFIEILWPEIDPDPFIPAWYIGAMAEHLQAVYENEISNLVINIPPGMAKSLLSSVLFPAWTWVREPTNSLLCSTKDNGNLKRDSFKFFNLVSSTKYQQLFPHVKIGHTGKSSEDGKKKISEDYKDIQNLAKGFRRALTTGSTTTGARGKITILDDPNDRSDIHSKVKRDATNDYVFKTLATRNFSKRGGSMIIVMQRLHEEDVAGMAIEKGFDLLKLPMEANGTSRFSIPGKKDPRLDGEFLNPKLFDQKSKQDMIKKISLTEYTGQYQQEPSTQGGNIFLREDWQIYKSSPSDIEQIGLFIDAAQKPGITNDFSVFAVWAKTANGYYLLDLLREKTDAPLLEALTLEMAQKWRPDLILIEDKSAGSSLIQYLRHDTVLPVLAYEPGQRDKVVRATAATPTIRAGKCYLPENIRGKGGANLVDEFIKEHETFPRGKHDDMVDTTSMMVKYFNKQSTNSDAPLIIQL